MRRPFLPPPEPQEVGAMTVHELLRDFPESLPVLTEAGIELPEAGSSTVPESLVGASPGGRQLMETLIWRKL